ncbi:MAG TPA: hypothetical protein VLL31_06215 [Sulfurovum sp.]|nr:hypothetical protein [Sulfurovum sp.]
MNLLKFFFGIVLAQAATYLLLILAPGKLDFTGFLRVAMALLFIALVLAFWLTSVARDYRKEAISKVKEDLATENDRLRTSAQHARADFKAGAAFAGVLAIGVLFVFAQMTTVGLLAISATVGAMGGYYWRGKRLENHQLKEID